MAKNSKKAAKVAEAEKQKTIGPVIYVGPPIKGTLLHSTFTIFAEGIPEGYEEHPTLKHLFVPPERLEQARREIGRTGSLRNTYYKRAVKEQQEKGGK